MLEQTHPVIEGVFFLSVFFVFYPYLGYPLVLYMLSSVFGRDVAKGELPEGSLPSVSLIISAYNEEDVIEAKLRNSLELDYPGEKLEIIVASESDDRTNLIAGRYAPRGVKLFSFTGRRGKASTLFRTVPNAKGEIVVFSDANGMYEKDAIRKLVRNFADGRVGCVSGLLRYENPEGVSVGKGEGLYWRYEMMVKGLESRLFSFLGATGSIFAMRRELYRPLSEHRGDDFELPVRIAQEGHGVVFEPEAVSREMSSDSAASEFKRKARIVAWNMESALLLLKGCIAGRRPLLAFQLLSHKILRWLVPLFLLGALVSDMFLTAAFYKVLLAAQALFYSAAVLGYGLDMKRRQVPGPLNVSYYFCIVNLAALLGIYRLLYQGQGAAWEKVRG
jgi:cellulose synthase/poly-beta-1,6-N-acetylglucosamine synthase-like glycosyltransferase